MRRPLNPFDPSRPIDPTKFVGRYDEVRELEAALEHAKKERPRHFLITGERGVGKTSFFDFIRKKATSFGDGGEFNFAVVDFSVNKQTTRLDFARALQTQLDSVLSAHPTHKETLRRVWAFIQRIEAAGFSYKGEERAPENHRDLYQEVAESLCEIVKRVCNSTEDRPVVGSDGVLILVDEVDQASGELDIGSFLKYMLESLNRKGCHRVVVGLAGLSKATQVLLDSHLSALRIFDELVLKNLTRNEVKELLDEIQLVVRDDGFGEFMITQDARDSLFDLSGGHPHMLHQFGYSAFEAACKSAAGEFTIEGRHVQQGAFENRGALDMIGDMYFRVPYQQIEGNLAAIAVIDHLSETEASESIAELARQATVSERDTRVAIDLLVSAGLLEDKGVARFGIKHPAFAFWAKAQRPMPA